MSIRFRSSPIAWINDDMPHLGGDTALERVPVMQALKHIGCAGWIVREADQDPAVADPARHGQLGLQTLRSEAAAAGYRAAA